MMFSLLLATALTSQLYGLQTPRPQYDPANYHRLNPDYIFPYASGVGPSRTINLQYPKLHGTATGQDVTKKLFFVTLDSGEKIHVKYGPTTWITGTGSRVTIDKPNRVLTFSEK